MADRPIKQLGFRTPLEVASIPNITDLARKGALGLLDVIAPGHPPGSDTAHLALLGYDPFKTYPGRGIFEAAGVGINLVEGDVAFRGNLATISEDQVIVDRRAGRITEGADALVNALKDIKIESVEGVKLLIEHATEHRFAVVFRGLNLSPSVTDTDPHEVGVKLPKCQPTEHSLAAERTAKAVNEFTEKALQILREHPINLERKSRGLMPANAVLLRGPAMMSKIPTLEERFNIKSACVAAVALVKGVCKIVGMEVINVPGATGAVDSKLENKADAAVQLLRDHDLVFINVKGADEASHDADIEGKIRVIEKLDSMVGRILNNVEDLDKLYIVITADHATPISVRNHTGDPTPLLICGPEVLPDGSREFSEKAAMHGGLGRLRGMDVMPILMNYLGKMKKVGA